MSIQNLTYLSFTKRLAQTDSRFKQLSQEVLCQLYNEYAACGVSFQEWYDTSQMLLTRGECCVCGYPIKDMCNPLRTKADTLAKQYSERWVCGACRTEIKEDT